MFELPPAPRMSGAVLRSVVAATGAEPVRRAIAAIMRKDLGIEAARALPASAREEIALHALPTRARDRHEHHDAALGPPRPPSALVDSRAYAGRYRRGAATRCSPRHARRSRLRGRARAA